MQVMKGMEVSMKKSDKNLYDILRKGLAGILTVFIISTFVNTVHADAQEIKEPDQKSYTYSYWGAPAKSPDPYVIDKVITGEDIGCGNFYNPMDVFRAKDGRVYVADTGNNRIVELGSDGEFLKEFKGAADGSKLHEFSEPQGVFVTDNNEIYVADTKNGVVVHMDSQGNLIRMIERPAGAVISDKLVYAPSRVVVDKNGLIYVVSLYVNQGIIEYSADGKFEGFLAAGKVNPNPIEVFWKKFSTKAQRDRMVDFVPIEYNNIAIDKDGFIYATMAAMNQNVVLAEIASKNGTEEGTLVRKLNLLGSDILRQEGFYPPVGDVDVMESNLNFYGAYPGISTIVDVSYGDFGVFSILDSNRKRVFTYDSEGNLLYAFGGAGTAAGGFMTPVSMTQSEDHMYVLDKATGALTFFKQTDYASAIHDAIAFSETGQYDASANKWQEILNKNANMDLAYTGIGKALFRAGNYKEAMKYFKNGYNKDWYSKAYQEYRKTKIASGFPIVAMILITLFLALMLKKIYSGLKQFLKGGVV
jgi:tetratricopeptide (TPR) repeat protein